MAIDLHALIQAVREDSEQGRELRQALYGDGPDLADALASLTSRVDALATAQGRTEARVEELAEAQGRTEARVEELAQAQGRTEARVEALAQAQGRTETRLEALTARVDELTKHMHELSRAQHQTAETVTTLVDTVRGMHDRLAKLDGDALERRYRERGHAYFMRIARRLRHLDLNTLSPMVDDAEQDLRLTELEATSLLNADAVFRGQRRDDRVPVHLVVEASVTIARYDVRRARERADLLARIVDTPVLAAVAGEFAPAPVQQAAQDAEVWCVTNGHAIAPGDDLDP